MESTNQQQMGRSLHRLGRQLTLRKQFDEARESLTLSVQLDPASAEACFELGNLLHVAGRHAEAAERYSQAIQTRPHYAEAWYNLGVVRMILRDLGQSRACFERALTIDPAYAEAHNNLAILMQAAGQMDDAIAHYRQAGALRPEFLEPQYNLGLALQGRKQFEECAAVYLGILGRDPRHVDARNNLANVLLELGVPEAAREHYRHVVRLDPMHPEANWNLGLTQLQLGEWREGWKNYEWRFRQPASRPDEPLTPRWEGRPLRGARILLKAEQGLGDMLQFLRFVPEVAALGGRPIVEVHAPLAGLASRLPGVHGVAVKGDPTPDHDWWAPLMSLPFVLGHANEPAAMRGPYLAPEADRVRRWRKLRRKGGLTVAFVWSGNANFQDNAKRSLSVEEVRSLVEGVDERIDFVSLQKGQAMASRRLIDPGDDPTSLEDAAAILTIADLTVTVDTSIAHLSGALHRPTWTLLAKAADWRWMAGRGDSPWYSSMRLFRQAKRGDWTAPIDALRGELGRLLD